MRCEADERVCVPDHITISINISDPLTCRDCGISSQWRCNSGACIDLDKVCDDIVDCGDGSDESYEAYEGCNLYPDNTEPCSISVRGERHVRCEADPTVCVPESLANSSDCRQCEDNKWRCNGGRCIEQSQFRDGKFDCYDETDEIPSSDLAPLRNFTIIVVIFFLVGLNLLQLITPLYHRSVHCPEFNEEFTFKDDWIPPTKLIELLDIIVEEEDSPRLNESINGLLDETSPMVTIGPTVPLINSKKEAKAKYHEMKNSKEKYHHLYMYIENRYTDKKLSIARDFLYTIEEEMDGKDWYLFGEYQGTAVLKSMAKHFDSDTAKNLGCLTIQSKENCIFYYLSTIFCFERIKNFVLFIIFWMALGELPLGWEYFYIICFLLLPLSFVVVQWRHYEITTRTYKEPLFEHEDSEIKRKINKALKKSAKMDSEAGETNTVLRIGLCVILSTVMPLIVTAKHAWYSSVLTDQRRQLREAQRTQENRIKIYKKICKLESKILIFRKCLSQFYMSSVWESVMVIVCLFLLFGNSQVRDGVGYRITIILFLASYKIQSLMLVVSLYGSFFSVITTVAGKNREGIHIQEKRLTKEINRRKLRISELTKPTSTTIGPTCWVEMKSGRGWAEIKLEKGNQGEYLEIAKELRGKDFIR